MGNKKTYKERQNVKHRKSLGLSGYNIRSSRKSEVVKDPEFVLSPKKAPIEQKKGNFIKKKAFFKVKKYSKKKFLNLNFFKNGLRWTKNFDGLIFGKL